MEQGNGIYKFQERDRRRRKKGLKNLSHQENEKRWIGKEFFGGGSLEKLFLL
jgi:hypothetical protein